MCYPFVELNHPSRTHAQYSRVFPCPLHTVFSFIIALYSHKNYLLPCIVFVYSNISTYPSTYTLYSLVSSLYSHISPYPSRYPLYSLVSSLYSHISPYPSRYPLYSLVSSFYSHISPYPFTYPLYSLVSSFYSHISPYRFTYTLYSLLSSLYSHIRPVPFLIYPLHSCIVSVLLYIPIAFYISPLLSFISLLIIRLMNLQDNGLGNSPVKPRSKRSSHHDHSKKLSIKDLALELAKKHVSTVEPR